jgi:carboxyl-terminal processing protease
VPAGDDGIATRPPFAGEPCVVIVLPEQDPTLGGNAPLLELERAEFEAELGTHVEVATADPGEGPRWLLVVDRGHDGPPTIAFDREARLVVSRAADADGVMETLSLWRTVARAGGGAVAAVDCADREQAIERVVVEVADTYPAFELRGLDWQEICSRNVDAVRAAADPVAAIQRWLAELEDAHTWVWAPFGNLPYAVRVAGGAATFARVREGTDGHERGVRVGWRLAAIDSAPVDAAGWLARTAAPPHSRPLLAGRRLLAGPVGVRRALTAVSPTGETATWEEAPSSAPEGDVVTWRRVSARTGYVRIEAWIAGRRVDELLDAAFAELRGCAALVLDLRGNPGGNLVLACRTRDRFLRERTALGSIRYSVGDGRLSHPFPLVGEPPPPEKRWAGRLVILTDPLTFSASEDFLLGLQGLGHVVVVGESSGGGSGRPRALRLFDGWRLTVSTALTYDRDGHCVEGAGVPVDVEERGGDDEALAVAETL